MTQRDKIAVGGVPGIWTTSLSDEDVRAFYAENGKGSEADDLSISVFDRVLKIRYLNRFVPFKHGLCRWVMLEDQNWVDFRTVEDWNDWRVQQGAAEEARHEEDDRRNATGLLLRTESDHHQQLARAAVLAEDWITAERHLLARADVAGEIERLKIHTWWSYPIIENVAQWFANFPSTTNGIEFLRRYDCQPRAFLAFAETCAFRWRDLNVSRDSEIERVFGAATSLFSTDGDLFKQTCLFWRRRGRFDLAIKFCELGIEQGVTDDTKSGFVGRLKRLERESNRQSAESAPL